MPTKKQKQKERNFKQEKPIKGRIANEAAITVHSEIPHVNTPALTAHIKRCICMALDNENILDPCEINVLLTNNAGIRKINQAYRNVDRETDVLSFPMFEFTPGRFPQNTAELKDPGSGSAAFGGYGDFHRKSPSSSKGIRT